MKLHNTSSEIILWSLCARSSVLQVGFFSSLFLLFNLKTQKWQDVRACLWHVTDEYQTGFVPPLLQNSGFIPVSSKLSLSSVRNMQNHLESRPIFKLNETGIYWVYCKNMEQRCQSHSKIWHKATRNVLK